MLFLLVCIIIVFSNIVCRVKLPIGRYYLLKLYTYYYYYCIHKYLYIYLFNATAPVISDMLPANAFSVTRDTIFKTNIKIGNVNEDRLLEQRDHQNN